MVPEVYQAFQVYLQIGKGALTYLTTTQTLELDHKKKSKVLLNPRFRVAGSKLEPGVWVRGYLFH